MNKSCFVICPIGEEGSDIRKRSDQILKHIIKPILEPKGYTIIRADEMPEVGVITKQIISAIITSDLVIADLTGKNPNVFYELAFRHATRKPFIQLIIHNETIPFDLASIRTIKFNLEDPDDIEKTKTTLYRQLEAIESGHKPDSPISMALSSDFSDSHENAMSLFLEKFWQMEEEFERLNQVLDSMGVDINSVRNNISTIDDKVSNIESNLSDIDDKMLMLMGNQQT